MSIQTNQAGEPISVGSYKIHPLANLFPLMNELEQTGLELDIKDRGQELPVLLYRGFIVDGRCRTLACTRLGVKPITKDLPHKMHLDDVRALVMSSGIRRNLTTAQKAVMAVRAVNANPTLKLKEAGEKHAVGNNDVSAANYIDTNYPAIANEMFNGNKISIGTFPDGKPKHTKSIQRVATYLRGNPYSHTGTIDAANSFEVKNHKCSCGLVEAFNEA